VKFVDEYRDEADAVRFIEAMRGLPTRSWNLMEICGGQTHTIIKSGIDRLLPPEINMVHGPGCPVCVTPLELIDRAIAIARRPEVIFTSFGDMLRVPGSSADLLSVKADGGDVRMVYSPLDALTLAHANPGKQVVFFAVGFETTAPANAMAVWRAAQEEVENFSILCSHVLVPPAMEALLGAPDNLVQGFLAAGHVCSVMGYWEYEPIAERYRIPIVVTGFEPLDLLQGTYMTSVTREGNVPAQQLMEKVFQVVDRPWRGIGPIPMSGYALRAELSRFDAERRFEVGDISAQESPECIAGEILKGLKKPHECSAFGTRCTPERPLGAPMVSSEGACAAYYHYGRIEELISRDAAQAAERHD
jgi:hydrogenase expression/formation protein HypD